MNKPVAIATASVIALAGATALVKHFKGESEDHDLNFIVNGEVYRDVTGSIIGCGDKSNEAVMQFEGLNCDIDDVAGDDPAKRNAIHQHIAISWMTNKSTRKIIVNDLMHRIKPSLKEEMKLYKVADKAFSEVSTVI